MPLFRKKPAAPAAPAPAAEPLSVPILKFQGDQRALAFEAQLEHGQWQELHDFLDGLTDQDQRSHYVAVLSSPFGRREALPDWADEWVAARPGSALPLAFRGSLRTNWAWHIRGGSRASKVKEDAWPVFEGRLQEADKDLARAAEVDERDPLPHALSLTTARGLSLGQAELGRRFEQVHRRDPLNAGACVSMIQGTARKWGGSHEAMFEFARWASGQAPDGHPVHKVIALAHIEKWLDSLSGERQQTYFRVEAVKQEVRDAARRSVLSPGYPRTGSVLSWHDRNSFAFCFCLMQDYEEQLEQMRLIGPHVTSFPWSHQGKAGKKYEAQRQLAYKRLHGVPAPAWDAFVAGASV